MSGTRRVLVTGMGVVSPLGGRSTTKLWQSLLDGECALRRIDDSIGSGYAAQLAPDVKQPLLEESKRTSMIEAAFSVYAVDAARSALLDSGFGPSMRSLPLERTAVAIGSGLGAVEDFNEAALNLENRGSRRVSPYFIARVLPNMAAAAVARHLGITGPCSAPSTACAASAQAIGDAYRLLKHGYADVAVCGGSEACIHPLAFAGFSRCRALANSVSRPFHKLRDGFAMGEGAAVLVLEAVDADGGQRILERDAYAEIVGYGQACDTGHVVTPRDGGLPFLQAMNHALVEAKCKPTDVVAVHAHATGTPLGDLAEATAISKLMHQDEQESDGGSCVPVTSLKGAVGHLLGAAGAIEAVVAIMSVANGFTVPPIVGLDSESDVDNDLLSIGRDSIIFPTERYRVNYSNLPIVLSNSSGFGGTTVSLAFGKASR